MTLDTWRAAADGDASGLWFQSFMTRLIFPRIQVWGEHGRDRPARRRGREAAFRLTGAATARASATR